MIEEALAPRVPVAELPEPYVPSHTHPCARCGEQLWCSDSSLSSEARIRQRFLCYRGEEASCFIEEVRLP